MRASELDQRLTEWADEYCGGRYDYVGWPASSSAATLILYHGRAPQGLHQRVVIGTKADQVEDVVRKMEAQRGGGIHAAVLRVEYWMRSGALEHKLQRLRECEGAYLTEDQYKRYLVAARDHVGSVLNLSDGPKPKAATCAK